MFSDFDRNYKILAADDDQINIELLKVILGKHYDFKSASSGQECLELLKSTDYIPDLILLDIVMPKPDGFETCAIIKQNPLFAEVPVIFLTSKSRTEDKVKAFSLGGSDYITKPFEFEEVLARINMQLELKKANEKISRYNKDLEKMLDLRTKELIKSERASAFSLMVQGIIHNLKGPIAIANGNSEIINTLIDNHKNGKSELNEKLIEIISKSNNRILAASHKMNKMVESMMIKSRTDKTDESEITDLNKILRQELEFMDADLNYKHKIKKTVLLCDGELPIKVVLSEVNQVVENLIRNSIDALWQQVDGELTVESGTKNGFAWFSLADNGPGIPLQNQDTIFDPFFTTKPRERVQNSNEPLGTGLGLYSCQEIINSYNGTISLDKSYKQGAKFVIAFPLVVSE